MFGIDDNPGTEALRQFETCKRVLLEELDVEPSISTIGLYYKIVKDNLRDSNHNLKPEEIDHRKAEIQINETLTRISNLISLQESIQEEILNEIHTLEETSEDRLNR